MVDKCLAINPNVKFMTAGMAMGENIEWLLEPTQYPLWLEWMTAVVETEAKVDFGTATPISFSFSLS